MKSSFQTQTLVPAVFGSTDFCRRLNSLFHQFSNEIHLQSGSISEAWTTLVESKPNFVIIEIGLHHSDRLHRTLRRLLEQMRERFKQEVFVAVSLNAPDNLAYGGDLLFENDFDLKPSGFVDTFLALPPGNMPGTPAFKEQLYNTLELVQLELKRRSEGQIALPSLGMPGWANSIADPVSRELWMRWLPRYASYTNENPIIIGETGTGKTNLAYALHLLSGRKGEFVAITPRDFSSSELIQAELFGAVAGAYTGAVDKWGLVKRAEKGTLFIDELQSIDKDLQGKLITFIENKIYRRVGSAETVSADVRFVFASNRTLYDLMQSQILRDDFAYRLERVQLELQPLKMRRLDVVSALAYALAKIQRQRPNALHTQGITSTAYRMLISQYWPGNLRQLENIVAKLCEVADLSGQTIIDEKITSKVFGTRISSIISTPSELLAQASLKLAAYAVQNGISSLEEGLSKLVEISKLDALEANAGNVAQAASLLKENADELAIFAEAIIASKENS